MPDDVAPGRKPGPAPTPRRKTSLLLTVADEAMIDELRTHFGVQNTTDVIRTSLKLALENSRKQPRSKT